MISNESSLCHYLLDFLISNRKIISSNGSIYCSLLNYIRHGLIMNENKLINKYWYVIVVFLILICTFFSQIQETITHGH